MALHRPESIDDAVALMGRAGAIAVSGGTDLYPALRDGPPPRDLVDLGGIAAMRGVSATPGGWRIGGATSWSALQRAGLPRCFDGLKAAAREVGSVQIQNAGTVAGNLCNASPAADGVPALLVLDASVVLHSAGGERRLPLAEFITAPRRTALHPGEILTAVEIPRCAGRGVFLKLGARRYLVISVAMLSALVETRDGRIARARLAVGACSPVARRLPALEAALEGCTAEEAATIAREYGFPELSPIDDVRAPAGYRLDAVPTLAARAIRAAMAPGDGADASKETGNVA